MARNWKSEGVIEEKESNKASQELHVFSSSSSLLGTTSLFFPPMRRWMIVQRNDGIDGTERGTPANFTMSLHRSIAALCELGLSGARAQDCNAGCLYLRGRADPTETKVV